MEPIEYEQAGLLIKNFLRNGLLYTQDSVEISYDDYKTYGTYYDYDFDVELFLKDLNFRKNNVLSNGLPENWDEEVI